MKKMKRVLSVLLSLAMVLASVQLGSLVPSSAVKAEEGEKEYEIYPTPHELTYGDGELSLGTEVNVVFEETIDEATKQKLSDILDSKGITHQESSVQAAELTNILVGTYGSGGSADQFLESAGLDIEGHFDKIDAYALAVSDDCIAVVGKDTDAAFYGLATLQMMFDQSDGLDIRKLTILDYSDTYYRGFIEGYYGIPWSDQNRMDLMKFAGMIKSNVYVFAPKDDPYHNSQWREPYPEDKLKDMEEMVSVGAANKCRFVWSIHPFMNNGVTDSNYHESVEAIKTKFEQLYKIGVRQFGVLADDAGSISNELIVRLMNDLNEWRAQKGDVYEFLFCPPAYNWAFAGYTWTDLQALNQMDEDVNFFWTGQGVCGHVTNETVTNFTQNVGRQPLFWLNWPVNDINSARMLMGKGEVLNTDVTGLRGVITNPMQQSEPSKVAIFAVSDYAWNIEGFNAEKSWKDSFQYIEPDAPDSLYTLAKHLSDPSPNNHGLVLEESAQLAPKLTAFLNAYESDSTVKALGADLIGEFEQIIEAADTFEAASKNAEMVKQLQPWTASLRLLSEAAICYIQTAIAVEEGNDEQVWAYYSQAAGSFDASKKCQVQNKDNICNVEAGSKRLIPFVTELSESLSAKVNQIVNPQAGAFEPLSPVSLIKSGISSIWSGDESAVTDNDASTSVWYVTDGNSLPAGGYFGIDIGKVMNITHIRILQGGAGGQGTNDYIPNAILEYSEDGEDYTVLENFQDQKDIDLDVSRLGVRARYIRLRAAANTNKWFAIREFAAAGSEGDVPVHSVAYTNVAVLSRRPVVTTADRAVLSGIGRELTLKPGQYIGVALPRIRDIADIDVEVSSWDSLILESSMNSVEWENVNPGQQIDGLAARYVRLINHGGTDIAIFLDKLEVLSNEIQPPRLIDTNISAQAIENADYGFDGDLSTQASFKVSQKSGQYMIYDLGQTISVDKLKFVITDGYVDYIRGGEISLSSDGENWSEPVIVIGEHTDPSTAMLGDLYDNEVPYYTKSSQDDLGIEARYVKIAITKDYSARWTRFQEILINDGAYIPVENDPTYLTDTLEMKGHRPSYLTDGDVSTTYASSISHGPGSLTYRVSDADPVTGITVLQNPETISNAKVSIRTESGWVEIGSLSSSLNVFDNLSYENIFEIKFVWEEIAPTLHEMYLTRESAPLPEPIDKTELEEKYQEARKIEGKYYEASSYAALETAVLDAEGVLGYRLATAQDVTDALQALNQALEGLRELPADTAQLAAKVQEAKALRENEYTEESYGILAEAIAEAERLIQDENVKQKALDAQLDILQEAMDALVLKGEVTKIPSEELTATAGSEEGSGSDGDASAAIDGDESTHWHSNWSGSADKKPDIPNNIRNEYTIDVGKLRVLRKLEYVPRSGSRNGRILGYKLYYSKTADGDDFVEIPKAEGSWADTQDKKSIEFPTVTARRIQIRATSTAGDTADAFISAAEFYVYEVIADVEPEKPKYSVSFTAGGGTGNPPEPIEAEAGTIVTLPQNPFVRDGYLFKGWSDGENVYPAGASYTMPEGTVIFTAQWEEHSIKPTEYTVIFDAAGGSVTSVSVTVEEGREIGPLPVPVREGYEFLGWYTQANGGVQVTASDKVTGDMTLYAHWKQDQATPPKEELKAPGKVTALKASGQKPKQLKLTWDQVPQATGYYIYRYDSGKKAWIKLTTTAATSFINKGLKAASIYQYQVVAYTQKGQEMKTGVPSDVLTTASAPGKPVLKSLKQTGAKQVKLIWKKDRNANGYEIWMKKGKGTFKKISSRPKKAVSYVKKKLKKQTIYTFKIRSFRKAGGKKVFSAYSKTRRITLR